MHPILDTINRLSKKQKITLALSVLVAFLFTLGIIFNSMARPMKLLYSGLDEIAVAQITDELEKKNVYYEHRDGAVFIEKKYRDEIRLDLARKGLPKVGQSGYELLDNLSGFGTTSEMFQASYWRAKEGELARTISSMNGIEEARVHIAPQQKTAFIKDGNEPSASVMVRMNSGASLNAQSAQAIRHLVALAVRSLSPNKVTVIDAGTGLIIGQNTDDPSLITLQKKVEMEARLTRELEQLIGAHVGMDKVKVTTAVALSHEEEVIRQRTIDPDSKTVISTDTTDTTEDEKEAKDGTVTVANNIPAANNTNPETQTQSSRSESRERVNYEVSEKNSEQRRTAGAVERITVAVLVDGTMTKNADGTEVWTPRSAEELQSIEDLVKSATGFNKDRGDSVTIRSLEFKKIEEGTPPPTIVERIIEENTGTIIQSIAIIIAVCGLTFGIVLPLLRLGNETKFKQEISKIQETYESRLKEFEVEPEPEEAMNSTQIAILEAEAALNDHADEALMLIRQWLHEEGKATAKTPPTKSLAGMIQPASSQ